jgi:hypothetical protein
MKKFFLIAGCVAVAAASQAQIAPYFKHVKRIDLSTLFATGDGGTTVVGDIPSDVATDGTDIFIAGMRSQAGPGGVGVVKVTNPLGIATSAAVYTRTGGGDGTDAKIIWLTSDPSFYFAFSCGTVDLAGGLTGIVRLDPNGTAYATFSGDGIATPSEIQPAGSNSARIDCLGADLRGANRVDVGFRNRGALSRMNPLTGAVTGGISVTGNTSAFTAVRHVEFDTSTGTGSGNDLFYRSGNDLFYGERTTNSNLGSSQLLVDLAGESGGGAAQQTIAFRKGDGSYLNTIVYNDRSAQTVTGGQALFVSTVTMGAGAVATAASTISGEESINGVAQQGFTSTILSAEFAKIGGVDYLLVTGIAGPSSRRVLSIYELSTTPPPVENVVTGKFVSPTWDGTKVIGSMTVEIRNNGNVIDTKTVTVDEDGDYSFTTTASGVNDVWINGGRFLSKLSTGVDIVANTTLDVLNLGNGDANADESCDLLDYFALSDSYNLALGDSGFDAGADFNGDDSVDLLDYFILSDNYNSFGDE